MKIKIADFDGVILGILDDDSFYTPNKNLKIRYG